MSLLLLSEIHSGPEFEQWFFGRHSTGIIQKLPYKQFESAYEEAKRNQGDDWNPFNPQSPHTGAQRLMYGVKEAIRVVTHQTNPQVAIYRLVGTRFDYFHGADGAVEYDGERVLFDITISKMKHKKRTDFGDPILLITLPAVTEGRIVQIGYHIGLTLLIKKIRKEREKYLGDLELRESSGLLAIP